METGATQMLRDYLTAWNSHDVERLMSFFGDDCVYEDVALGIVRHGKGEVYSQIESVFVDLPDLKMEVKSVFAVGDRGAGEWTMTGTFAHSSNPGMPATGKYFAVRGATVFEIREGRITRNTDYLDLAAFLRQVGLMPGAPPTV